MKAEYMYADLGEASVESANLTAFPTSIAYPTNVFTHSVELHTGSVRVGLKYRF